MRLHTHHPPQPSNPQPLQAGFNVSKTLREYAVYDSNVRLDSGWAEKSSTGGLAQLNVDSETTGEMGSKVARGDSGAEGMGNAGLAEAGTDTRGGIRGLRVASGSKQLPKFLWKPSPRR